MKTSRVPEKIEQAHVVQLLRSIGGKVYVLGTRRRKGDFHGTMMTEGLPDVISFLPMRTRSCQAPARRMLVVECKAVGGRLRPEQSKFRDLCQTADIAHIVGGLDAVIAWLATEGYVNANSFPHYRQPKG
jgi:hypothetical protein